MKVYLHLHVNLCKETCLYAIYIWMYVYMFITHIVLKVVTPRRFFTERGCMQINLDTYPTQGQYNIRTQSHSLGDEYI